jgi:hypothetical protein
MVDERTRGKMTAGQALAMSGISVFGVGLAGLPRAFSWDDLGAMVVIWAFFFLLLMAFSGRLRPTRRR